MTAHSPVTKDLYDIGEIPPLGHVPAKMWAWAIRKERHGAPEDAMQLEAVPTWSIGDDEVLVLVMAAGVNYNGVWAALGKPISPIDGHKSSLHALFTQHPKDNGKAIELPSELAAEAKQLWDEGGKKVSEIQRRKDEVKARIQQHMGSAKFALLPDGTAFRWSRNGKSGRFERVDQVRDAEMIDG